MALDDTDRRILAELEKDARVSYTDLAKKLRLSDVAVKKRIDRLLKNGVIKNFSVNLNHEKLGRGLRAFLLLKTTPSEAGKICEEVSKIDGVLRILPLIGAYDFLVEATCKDVEELRVLTEERVGSLRGILEARPLLVV